MVTSVAGLRLARSGAPLPPLAEVDVVSAVELRRRNRQIVFKQVAFLKGAHRGAGGDAGGDDGGVGAVAGVGRVLGAGEVVCTCVDAEKMRIVSAPDEVVERFSQKVAAAAAASSSS